MRNQIRRAAWLLCLVPGLAGALAGQEARELGLANRYYEADDYGRAYVYFQDLLLRQGREGRDPSGDALYRYAYSYERLRGLDRGALDIYALSRYWNEREGRRDALYAQYAAAKLRAAGSSLITLREGEAAALMAELRENITRERKTRFYRQADRLYDFFSRFSLFQWKLIASAAALVPLLAGIIILKIKAAVSKPTGV
jgi:hypothetical protein